VIPKFASNCLLPAGEHDAVWNEIAARFGCEFFPARAIADSAGRSFLNFFQTDRFGQAKGIVRLELKTFPNEVSDD
jgi:hypothetical protein